MLVNDVSLRNLIPAELDKGFGFLQSKPAALFAGAVTPDELGVAWHDGKLRLPLVAHLNGQPFGKPNAGDDMSFDLASWSRTCENTRTGRRHHHRLGHGFEQGRGLWSQHSRTAAPAIVAWPSCAWSRPSDGSAADTVPEFRRPRPHRNARRGRQELFGAIEQEVVRYSVGKSG